MTDDLIGFVPFDFFGASIPTDDLSPQIQHKNCVVANSINQHAIFFFAVSQCLFGASTPDVLVTHTPLCEESG